MITRSLLLCAVILRCEDHRKKTRLKMRLSLMGAGWLGGQRILLDIPMETAFSVNAEDFSHQSLPTRPENGIYP